MTAFLLRTLRGRSRDWWYHAQLRRQGNPAEAARRERASVRSTIRIMRAETVERINVHDGWISFLRRPGCKEQTIMVSNVPPIELYAWIYAVELGIVRKDGAEC